MISWFVDNIGTLGVALIVISAVAGVVFSMRRGKKHGKTACGGNCGCCCGCRASENN